MQLLNKPLFRPVHLLTPVLSIEVLFLVSFLAGGATLVSMELLFALLPQLSIGFVSFVELFEVEYASLAGQSIALGITILIFPIQVLMMGGFIHLLAYSWLDEKAVHWSAFFQGAKRVFWKLLLFNLLLGAVVFGVGLILGLFAIGFGIMNVEAVIVIGVIFVAAILVLRILFLYLEFTIVLTNSTLLESFKESFRIRRDGSTPYFRVIALMFVVSIGTTLLIYAMPQMLWVYPIIGIVYIVAMVRIQLALMKTFLLNAAEYDSSALHVYKKESEPQKVEE
ncbi:hypothetical protein [Geomicrobium sp. JCM 19039]|uniref:hypothetical protein n=1 Tax=Geomicrobium sp. JCM 19039 TaxID=1460636 RepID=UPI00045F320A|nr:hypothetical protein [Geomicrobium sp. JCM 19039]GAK13767.1 hypothetical protein JCM19039_3638 [Geomicrobium sp. JCM 19039]